MRFIFLFLLALPLWAQPTVSSVRVDDIGHSSARVAWNLSAAAVRHRVQYGETSSYGGIAEQYQQESFQTNVETYLGGLKPNQGYHICPQSSNDGSTWSTCVDTEFTTAALPAGYPLTPTLPETFDASVPTQTGTTRTVGSNCLSGTDGLQKHLNDAVPGDTIVIPTTTTNCNGQFITPDGFGSKAVSSVDLDTNTFTSNGHGYANDTKVRVGGEFGVVYPLMPGVDYFTRNVAANTYQLALTAGGSAIDLTLDAGGNAFTGRIMAWPPVTDWVVIRTSATDAELPPPGVRITPEYFSKVATIYTDDTANSSASPGLRFGVLAHHYRLIGIRLTTIGGATEGTATDPRAYYGVILTNAHNSYITLDRSVVDGLGYPNRVIRLCYICDGAYIASVDSYWTNAYFWRPWQDGMAPSNPSGAVLRIAPGTFHLGSHNPVLASNFDFTITAGSTCSNCVFVTMPTSGTPRITVPLGVSISCSGSCTVTNTASPNWHVNGNGDYDEGLLARADIAAGPTFANVTAVAPYDQSNYGGVEGATAFFAQHGPGPFKLNNNYWEAAGIAVYWSDDNKRTIPGGAQATTTVPKGIEFRGNFLFTPLTKLAGYPTSDGRKYNNRYAFEIKSGEQALVEGNDFFEHFGEATPAGEPLLISNNSATVTDPANNRHLTQDITVRYNRIRYSNGCVNINIAPAIGNLPKMSRRIHVTHNLCAFINAHLYKTTQSGGYEASGRAYVMANGGEDFLLENNLAYDIRGPFPNTVRSIGPHMGGMRLRNNLFEFNDDNSNGGVLCTRRGDTSVRHKACMDEFYEAGPGIPSYEWNRNMLVAQFTNSQTLSGDITPPTASYAAAPATLWPTGANPAARRAAVKFLNPDAGNFRLRHDSEAFRQGVDGRDLGPDNDALERALGIVKGISARLTAATTFDIALTAPSATSPCYIERSTDGFSTFTRTTLTGSDRRKSVQITGLSAATAYRWRAYCETGIQPELTGGFRTP